jgi:hypothetical protein
MLTDLRPYLVVAVNPDHPIDNLARVAFELDEETALLAAERILASDHSIGTDHVAIYKLQRVGERQAVIKWGEEQGTWQEVDPIPETKAGHCQKWSYDENRYLLMAREDKIPYSRIAYILGRTQRAVEVQASRLRCGF